MNTTPQPSYTDEQVLERIKDVIGRLCTPDLLDDVQHKTERQVRAYGPGHSSTKDHRPERINLVVGSRQIITEICFG